jgi:heme/copper-type cytochrome/quinol oxidase subunit 4
VASDREPSMGFYLGLWIVMVCIAGLEVLMIYGHMSRDLTVALLLILAFVEGGIAILYFMHMKYENANFFWTLVPITIFAFIMLNQIWPDALRLARLNLWR